MQVLTDYDIKLKGRLIQNLSLVDYAIYNHTEVKIPRDSVITKCIVQSDLEGTIRYEIWYTCTITKFNYILEGQRNAP